MLIALGTALFHGGGSSAMLDFIDDATFSVPQGDKSKQTTPMWVTCVSNSKNTSTDPQWVAVFGKG